jgi:hypothetical protein
MADAKLKETTFENTKLNVVPLNWKEVYYTHCPLVSASNVDQELGRTREEYKKIGLSKSLNKIKNDWWRIQEHQGIELMLRMNGMTMKDVQIVDFPYADDWYNDPKMLDPRENPSELWLKRDHKHDLAFRPLETALEKGVVDAIYTQSKPFQHLQEATGKFKAIEDLSRYPDWTLQAANIPDMVPNLSPQNLVSVEIGKDFMLSHGYVKNAFDAHKWARPEFLEKTAEGLLEEQWKKTTSAKLPEPTKLLEETKRIG